MPSGSCPPSLRMLLIFTVILGVGYPLLITAIAQVPGLKGRADGSLIKVDGPGRRLEADRAELHRQQRQPAAAVLPVAPVRGRRRLRPDRVQCQQPRARSRSSTRCPTRRSRATPATQSLLTQVCSRSLAIGKLYGVDGSRPFCTPDGVGAVLAVFWSGPGYHGTITRVVSINQTAPATPFIATYQGVHGRAGASSARTTPRARSSRSAATRRPTRPCPPMR